MSPAEAAKVQRDLEDATHQLATYWTVSDDRDALGRVAGGAEALLRAVASLTLTVERQALEIEQLKIWHNALRTRVDCHENGERLPHMARGVGR